MSFYKQCISLALVFFEWLDFSLYLYLAKSIFAKQFFASGQTSIYLTYAIFIGAYLARPVGALLFGYTADKFGRKKTMMMTALLMGICTTLMSILPTFNVVGNYACIGLLLLRVGQGLAIGGEMHTAALFTIESCDKKPMLAGCKVAMSSALGMFTGASFAAVLIDSDITHAWRILFLITGFITLWICKQRRLLKEPIEFINRQEKAWSWRGVMNTAVLALFVSAMVYLCNAYWMILATDLKLFQASTCLWMAAIAQCFSAILAYPIAYFLNQKLYKRLLFTGIIITAINAPFLFYATTHLLVNATVFGMIFYTLSNAFICSAMFYFLYQQFPVNYRGRGISIVWAIFATFGACCLPLAQYLWQKKLEGMIGWVMTIIALGTLIVINHKSRVVKLFHININRPKEIL